MTLPNFLVIGAQRAGTSLLHQILLAHPDVYVPAQRKEVHYFDRYFERGDEWYQSYFPAAGAAGRYRAIGEITPDYLATEEAPVRIHALLPACRMIAILRNPVDRVYSWYQHARRSRNERRDFATFLHEEPAALCSGLYHRHLQSYLALFPREALLVLLYEELLRDPGRELGRLTGFSASTWSGRIPRPCCASASTPAMSPLPAGLRARAGAPAASLPATISTGRCARPSGSGCAAGSAAAAAARALSVAERERLAAFYRDDVRQLSALLRRELDLWQA